MNQFWWACLAHGREIMFVFTYSYFDIYKNVKHTDIFLTLYIPIIVQYYLKIYYVEILNETFLT